jgi:hypothetical protein
MAFHLSYVSGVLSWSNLKLLRHASALTTPFTLKMDGDDCVLLYGKHVLDTVTFPPPMAFYGRKAPSGMPYRGNAVLQGFDWVSFQCLWPCEYAASGKPCEFCFSGAEFENLAAKGKPLPTAVEAEDVAEVTAWAAGSLGCTGVQITGGSTFGGTSEDVHITAYLNALGDAGLTDSLKEILLYITPPANAARILDYYEMGATRIACSLEVWDLEKAAQVTPGKIAHTTRERTLAALELAAEKTGPAKAFSNLIIGIEGLDTLAEGAAWLAERGILPSASVWMPMGRPVLGTMKAPDLVYYQRAKDMLAELYMRHGLVPPAGRGLNVCVETDIYRYAVGSVAASPKTASSMGWLFCE